MKLRLFAVTCFALLGLAACGSEPDPSSSTDGIRGITWTTNEIITDGRAATMPNGSRLELTLGTDGTLGARAGCNSMSGAYRITDDTLVVTDLGQTEIGCNEDLLTNDEEIRDLLTARPSVSLAGGTLTLATATVTLHLVDLETTDPASPLVGPTWVLDTILDGQTASTPPPDLRAPVTLTFETAGLTWATGCNTAWANYRLDRATLGLDGGGGTLVGCSEPEKSVEARLAQVLAASPTVTIVRHRLTITAPNGDGFGFTAR